MSIRTHEKTLMTSKFRYDKLINVMTIPVDCVPELDDTQRVAKFPCGVSLSYELAYESKFLDQRGKRQPVSWIRGLHENHHGDYNQCLEGEWSIEITSDDNGHWEAVDCYHW